MCSSLVQVKGAQGKLFLADTDPSKNLSLPGFLDSNPARSFQFTKLAMTCGKTAAMIHNEAAMWKPMLGAGIRSCRWCFELLKVASMDLFHCFLTCTEDAL